MSEDFEGQPQMRHLGLSPWLQTAWDLRAAGNFIGGGTGTGLLILVSAGAYYGIQSKLLLVAGLALVGLGLFSVFLEIGRPLRAMNVLFGGKRSWMTREAITAGILFPLGAAALVFPELVKIVWAPAAGYLYCQARILEATKGIPTWRSPLILPLILVTGLVEGAGALLLLAPLAFETGAAPEWVGGVLMAALAGRIFVWMFYRRKMVDGGAPVAAAAVLIAFSGPFTLGGNVMPIVMMIGAGLQPDIAVAALPAAGLAAMIGGWAMKITIVTKAAHNQGFSIEHAPARGSGEPGPGFKPGWRKTKKD
ncbi:phenylacetyl CoA [Paramagnetospirillum marisnigri]|uniref:Phenylacetyl CoA n=1 Tax=Paramagnetospirillum marisnigri TaxID=1285242 RepID=A0A178MDB8_9PROT|nr:DmsC/YnfH family molybdoenzyme membrane anchor subunit [Paramagnetospirillum marisnigri]OAN46759.1 phenylacetyl CoA [Paramagnetospirillum marisnigri]